MTHRVRRVPATRALLINVSSWIALTVVGAGCASEPATKGGNGSGVTFSNGYGSGDGFKGYWYTYKDSGGSEIKPDCSEGGSAPCFSMSAGRICASGTASQVQMAMYSTYWGAGLGWNLNQGMTPPNDPQPARMTGKKTVAVELDMKVKSPMRMKLKVADDPTDYCANVVPGMNTIPLTSITKECWIPDGEPLAEGAEVIALQFQIPTNDAKAVPFDFCITNLSIE